MRNKDEGRPQFAVHFPQDAENLVLDGSVERTCGFVRNQQGWPASQRLRDGCTMQLTNTKLVRIGCVNAVCVQTNLFQ